MTPSPREEQDDKHQELTAAPSRANGAEQLAKKSRYNNDVEDGYLDSDKVESQSCSEYYRINESSEKKIFDGDALSQEILPYREDEHSSNRSSRFFRKEDEDRHTEE